MKNKSSIFSGGIFSPGLYLEGIRQTRYIGLPFLCLAALCEAYSFLNILMHVGDVSAEISRFLAYCSFTVVAPLCMLTLYHFLNSRAASDFYHSVPKKRTAMCNSFAAAAFTWSAGSVMLASLWELLEYALFGSGTDVLPILQSSVISIVCTALVVAACLLGMTLTGTLISQIAAIGLILFMPRLLIAVVIEKVCGLVPTLCSPNYSVTSLASYRINFLIDSIMSAFFGSARVSVTWTQIIYTIVLAAVYYLIGLALFNARKSEKASQPAIGRFVQSAMRVLIAFLVCLLAYDEIVSNIASGSAESISIPMVLLVYGFALIAYVLYEIISSRSVIGLRGSLQDMLIGLAALVVLNIALIGGTLGAISSARAYQPDRADVKSVSFMSEVNPDARMSYSEIASSKVVITDSDTIDFALDTLRRCNEDASNGKFINNRSDYYVRFNFTDGSYKYRRLDLNIGEYKSLVKMLLDNEQFKAAYDSYPDSSSVIQCDLNMDTMSEKDTQALYKQLREELDAMSYDERAELRISNSIFDIADSFDDKYREDIEFYTLDTLDVYGIESGEAFRDVYRITPLTPKTAALYMKVINGKSAADNASALERIRSFIEHHDASENYYVMLNVDGGSLYDADGNYIYTETQYYECYFNSAQDSEEVAMTSGFAGGGLERTVDELLRNYSDTPDPGKPFYKVELSLNLDDGGDGDMYLRFFVNADDTDPMMAHWNTIYSGDYQPVTTEADTVSASDVFGSDEYVIDGE